MSKRPSRRHTLALTFASLLALQLGTSGDDWTQGGAGAAHSSATGELSGAPFDSGSWSVPTNYSTRAVSTPAAADGIVVFATTNRQIVGVRALDGTRIWTFAAGDSVIASPAISKGRVFVPALNGQLYALALANGSLLWQTSLGGAGYSSPTMVNDARFIFGVGFPQKKVVMIDASTGATVWQTAEGAISGIVNSSAAISGNLAIIGSMGGNFYGLDLATGAVRWAFNATGLVNMSSPLVSGGTAYLLPGGESAMLYAVDAASGALKTGWPMTITDPMAPPSGTIVGTNQAVSSPMMAGSWLVAQMRFDYSLQDPTTGASSYTLREYVVGIEPAAAAVKWMAALGTKDLTNPNDIPELNLCPTPAAFQAASGSLLAVSSTLSSTIQVLDPTNNGAQLWSGGMSAAGRSSPILANGRLFAGTDAGVLESYLSSVNKPPLPPAAGFSPANGEVVTTLRPTLSWGAGSDPEGKPITYTVRLSTTGEVLQNWTTEITTAAGVTQTTLSADLKEGLVYTYAVRSRDPNGAWSEWSAPQSFAVNLSAAAPITVNGTTYGTIGDALAAVPPGGTIQLGKGTLRLVQPLQLPQGVSLVGVSAWETLVDARGLGTGLALMAGTSTSTTTVEGLAIFGAATNMDVQGTGVVIRHVVIQGAAQAGLQVETGGSASLVNDTLAANAVGARSLGALDVKNSIVTGGSIGLSATGGGTAGSTYNDLFANTVPYDGTQAGTGDLAQPVSFSNPGAIDYRILTAQPTTDAGDPADDASQEPQPNGGRVNLGAFGGTPLAELSASPIVASSAGRTCAASASPSSAGFPLILLAASAILFFALAPRRLRLGRGMAALILLLLCLSAFGRPRLGTAYKWRASAAGNWDVTTNWQPNGTPGSTTGDTVTFDSTGGGDCQINITPANTIDSMTIDSSYSGTIYTGPLVTMTIGSGGLTQQGGTFITGGVTLNGDLSLTGGTLDISGNFNFGGFNTTWNVAGGGVIAGGGTLTFQGSGKTTFQPFAAPVAQDIVWVEDSTPAGASLASDGGDQGWRWVPPGATISPAPSPYSGKKYHESDTPGGEHQHYFYDAQGTDQLQVSTGDTLFCYVYIDPNNPPSEVMLQWNDGSWEHRAFWGQDKIGWGTIGTVSRHFMGNMPGAGWQPLIVNASDVGLEGSTLNGMAFTLFGGLAQWDKAGVHVSASNTDVVWVEDKVPDSASQASDGGDSWTWFGTGGGIGGSSPYSGNSAHISNLPGGEHQHYFYNATGTLKISSNTGPNPAPDTLFCYVYLDPSNPPTEVMLQWNDGSWEHRAYWGADQIGWGSNGTPSRVYKGPLPAADSQWHRLAVGADEVGLVGSTLNGMAFTLFGGRAGWDHAGRNGTGGAAIYNNIVVASGTVNLASSYSLPLTGYLSVNQGAAFTSDGSDISIAGDLTLDGSFTANATPVEVYGNLNLNATGTLNAPSGSSLLTVQGRFTGDGAFHHDNGNVLLLATGSRSLTPPALPFNNLWINDTLEGYWNFDAGGGVSGTDGPLDLSGYGRGGTLAGTTLPSYPGTGSLPPLNFNNANCLSFTASNKSYVNLTAPPALQSVSGVTIAGWIKPTSLGLQNIASFGGTAPGNGLMGEYYDNTKYYTNNPNYSAPPPPRGSPIGGTTTDYPAVVQYDSQVNFNPFPSPVATDMSTGTQIPYTNFMTAWTGQITMLTTGNYDFQITIDDGARVWIDNTKIIDSWKLQGATPYDSLSAASSGLAFTAGVPRNIRIEYYQKLGGAVCFFSYRTHNVGTYTVVPSSMFTPALRPRARLAITSAGQVVVDGSSSGGDFISMTSTTAPVTTTAWIHVAGVLDFGSTQPKISVYAGGVLVGVNSAAFRLKATPNNGCSIGAIGSEADGKSRYFDGLMDDVRVYGRALSPQEIAALALGNQPMPIDTVSTSVFLPNFPPPPSTLLVHGDLTLSSSTFDYGGCTVKVEGNWYNYGAATFGKGGTVELNGALAGKKILSGGQHFDTLNVTGSGTWTLADRLYVDSSLGLLNGSLNTSTYSNLHVGSINQTSGSFTPPSTLILSGTTTGTLPMISKLTTFLNNLRVENPKETTLIGYWKFDEGQGPVAGDFAHAPASSSRKDATLFGGATWTPSPPAGPGPLFDNPYAASFDGGAGTYAHAGAYNISPPVLPSSVSAQTVSLWFKYTGAGATQDLVTLTNLVNETNIGIFFSGTSRIGVRSGTIGSVLSIVEAPASSANVWHHLVFVYDPAAATKAKVYIDGVIPGGETTPNALAVYQPSDVYFGASAPRDWISAPAGYPSTTALADTTGSVTVGTHTYAVTFLDGNGFESAAGPGSTPAVTADSTHKKISLTSIPTGGAGVAGRRIYRTVAGNTGNPLFVATINDNTTTTYTDSLADSSLGSTPPTPPPGQTPLDVLNGFLDDVRIYGRALTATEVSALAAGRYAKNGFSMDTTSLGGDLTLNAAKTFDLDFGIFDANASAVTVPGAANVNGGTYKVGSSATGQTFTSGLTVHTSGGLDLSSDGGVVNIGTGAGPGLDIKGTLSAAPPGAGSTIQSGGGNYAFTLESTATLDVNGLKVRNANTLGMNIASGAVFKTFRNLDFASTQVGAGASHLTIATNTPVITAPGCKFDNFGGTVNTYNITFTGSPLGNNPRIYLEARNLAVNGAGAQDRLTAEGRTKDGDTNPRDGIADVVNNVVPNDGIVFWVYTAADDLSAGGGTIVGSPTPAFDWSGFAWYSTYVVYSVPGPFGSDTIYVRDQNGNIAGGYNSYSFDHLTYGSIIGAPVWDQLGDGTRVLYVALSKGYVFRLIDDTVGKALLFGDEFVGSTSSPPVTSITSPLSMDGTNLYFGGTDDTPTPKLFVLQWNPTSSPMSLVNAIDSASPITTAPSWGFANAKKYVYLGSDKDLTGHAYLYRDDITSVSGPDAFNNTPIHNVTGPTTLIPNSTMTANNLYAGDKGGRMHGLNASAAAGSLPELLNWPYFDSDGSRHQLGLDSEAYPILAGAYVDFTSQRLYYGDGDGHFYVLTSAAALAPSSGAPWPRKLTNFSFQSSALMVGASPNGKIVVGSTNGELFFIDEASATVYYTYNFGTGAAISDVTYSVVQGSAPTQYVFQVATSDGNLYYVSPR